MKYTLFLTQRCNLACDYCYVGKMKSRMSPAVARCIVDYAFAHTPPEETVDIGFFGGEPLLEFELLSAITGMVENHPDYEPWRVKLSAVTNGTIFTPAIADFLTGHEIGLGISCDGPPEIQDLFRRFRNGRGTSKIVEKNIRRALEALPGMMVNAVYHPRTLAHLPTTVD